MASPKGHRVERHYAPRNVINGQQAIISVKEAKKKLSPEVKAKLSDEQIEFVITKLEAIAREYIKSSVPEHHVN